VRPDGRKEEEIGGGCGTLVEGFGAERRDAGRGTGGGVESHREQVVGEQRGGEVHRCQKGGGGDSYRAVTCLGGDRERKKGALTGHIGKKESIVKIAVGG